MGVVAKVRAGASMRAVARLHRVSLSTVQWWMRRAGDLPLDKVDWDNRFPISAHNARTTAAVEDLVLMLRRELKERSAQGEYGAKAIHRELIARRHRQCRRCGLSAASWSDAEPWMAGAESAATLHLQVGTSRGGPGAAPSWIALTS